MSDNFALFLVGLLFGALTLGVAINLIPSSELNRLRSHENVIEELIVQCQKDLPRSKKCVLVAIPEETK